MHITSTNQSVSVIIPAYNCQKYLDKAIKSVMAQNYPITEIIVVDDCSTPPLRIKHGHGVRLLRNEKNKGAAYSRNLGVEKANGEIIAFLDADDEWHSSKIRKQLHQLDKFQQLSQVKNLKIAVLCGARVIKNGLRSIKLPVEYQNLKYFMSGTWFFPGSTLLIRREDFIEVGGFDTNLRRLEDYELFIRFNKCGGKISIVQETLCDIHRSPHANFDEVLNACMHIYEKHNSYMVKKKLKWRMLSYLLLEVGATAWYSKKYTAAIFALTLSIVLVPRLRLQLHKWWL